MFELYGHPFVQCVAISEAFRINSQMQDDACFIYVQQGVEEVLSPSEKIRVSDNEAILMKCGNYIANVIGASPISEFKSVVFHLDPKAIKKAFGNRELDFLRVGNIHEVRGSALKIAPNQLLESFMTSIINYLENPELVTESLLAVKLQELVLILCENGKNMLASQIIGTLYTPAEIEFEKVVEGNLYNKLSIGELAMFTNRSESTFKRDFKKWYHVSPARYFKKKKLDKAVEFLKTTNHQISEIAWNCGFENAAHFSASFHDRFGKSPKQYRVDLN